MKQNEQKLALSVVIPVMDEEVNVGLLHDRLSEVLNVPGASYEIIFIDDGSTDHTFKALKLLRQKDPYTRIIKFRGNFGQSAAMAAGFRLARGRTIVTMDGDLQNDPRDIPSMLRKLDEGYDVVCGWRKDRKDRLLLRKIPSQLANRLICSVTDVRLHDTGCALKVFRREVIDRIRLYGELHRFIPALSRVEGARITEVVVNHHPRRFGKSKYNLTRTFRVLMDLSSLQLFLRYLKNPLRFFGMISLLLLFVSLGVGAWIGFRFIQGPVPVDELNILVTLIFLLGISGFQFLFFGLVASLIVKTGERRGGYLSTFFTGRGERSDDV